MSTEKYQPGCHELAEEIHSRVLEAGELSVDGSYRLSSGNTPTPDELLKRVINNLIRLTKSSARYRIALIDIDESSLARQRDVLARQVSLLIRNRDVNEPDVEAITADIVDVITSSWHLTIR